MSREELLQLKNAELKAMCKERNLPTYKGKNALNKAEMVENLYVYETAHEAADQVEQPVEQDQEVKSAPKKLYINRPHNPLISPSKSKELKESINRSNYQLSKPWVIGGKDDVINEADTGILVAFLDDQEKPRTAKMIARNKNKRKLKLVTEFDREYIVSYDNVLWVKTGTRWPNTVYKMLKGYQYGQPVSFVRQAEEN